MDFKTFLTSVEESLSRFRTEAELRNWIKNYARSLPEDGREGFLEQLQERKSRSHKEMLREIIDWCEKIENGEIVLSCYSHEEYDHDYWTWDPDWVTEYEDPEGIGPQLRHYYEEAEQAVYDGDYESASAMYCRLGTLSVTAEDEDGMDPDELSVEEMVSEQLVKLDLKKIASLTLYSAYQAYKLPERVPRLYGFFSWEMFRDIGIENMMAAGREPLHGVDEFLKAWISYLREQDDSYTSRLLIEAVTYQGGVEGLLEEAKRTADRHPKLYIQILERFYEDNEWNRLRKEGTEALRLMGRGMEIREQAARLAAAGAVRSGKVTAERKILKEAFYSKPTAANYLRVITCGGMKTEVETDISSNQEMVRLAERLQNMWKTEGRFKNKDSWYRSEGKETDAYQQAETDRLGISFLEGDYKAVWNECRKMKDALGWSGEFISAGISMLLVYLYEGNNMNEAGKAMQAVFSEIEDFIRYRQEYGEPDFIERFSVWKRNVVIPESEKNEILKYLTETIDQRVQAIVGGTHRGSYWKAAKLGSALGEVEESLGKANGKSIRVQKYLKQFPRHRAFKEEMEKY